MLPVASPGNSHSRGLAPLLAISHASSRSLCPLDTLDFGADKVPLNLIVLRTRPTLFKKIYITKMEMAL